MAIKTKVQLHADTAALPAPITRVALIAVLDDMIDSWEDIIQAYTTAARNALTPVQGQKIFNTTNTRLEVYSGAAWLPCSQKPTVTVDASTNPNYPQGGVGDQYVITVAGFIGGAAGKTVFVGDLVYCISENAGGTEASVGTSWKVCHSQGATDTPTYYTEISLSSAQILASNATPIDLVAAPGAGKIIVPEKFITQFTYNSIAYATNITFLARFNSASTGATLISLDAAASRITLVGSSDWNPALSNTKLEVYTATGNPTAGNSTMKVGVYYKIHTL